jgi:hypothetical protein
LNELVVGFVEKEVKEVGIFEAFEAVTANEGNPGGGCIEDCVGAHPSDEKPGGGFDDDVGGTVTLLP